MGRIHVLSEQVANKIAAGEVVERPASVLKELLENSLDAGATRIKVHVEGGGKKLVQVTDNGCGMVRDDALLAFERHATSKIKNAEDLSDIRTLGFRGEALPSIASIARVLLQTHAQSDADTHAEAGAEAGGTTMEIAGGKILRVEEAGLPVGTSIAVRDLFFNTPARKKFLHAESTELSHIASLVTHYALAHPDKHFELHSATQAMLVAAPVESHAERIYQIFGGETLEQLIPLAAVIKLEHAGLPPPPPWRRDQDYSPPEPGEVRAHGFVSKPEVQKLNRNSVYVFVNRRLVRDRVVLHAITEAYRNILPAAVYPVVLLFLELPPTEVDVNVHPSKIEVRFRQQSLVHDFVRDSARAALMKARPIPQFTREITAHPNAAPGLSPPARPASPAAQDASPAAHDASPAAHDASPAAQDASPAAQDGSLAPAAAFALRPPEHPMINERLQFSGTSIAVEANTTLGFGALSAPVMEKRLTGADGCGNLLLDHAPAIADHLALASLKPLGQIRDSFIIAVNPEGLWIVDQHVAHERVLFEKILREQAQEARAQQTQKLLMPLIIGLTPAQQAIFTEIASELGRNGFEAEPFGARTIAVKTAPAGVSAIDVEHMLVELLDQMQQEDQALNLEKVRVRIAASVACHAAIKINTPLEENKMNWLLAELAKTACPMSCPHGRPVVLRYSVREIQRAFKRI